MLHACDVGRYQGLFLREGSEVHALRLQDLRAELAGHVGLAVLVKGHQLVHAEDSQLHIHLSTVDIMLQLGDELIHIAVCGNVVSNTVHHDIKRHHPLQQQLAYVVELGRSSLLLV